MHAYDVPRRQSGSSATPIYDELYAEYVKSFRALPGDRSGEEELGFTAFAGIPHGTGTGFYLSPYSAYRAGAHSARHGQQPQWQRVPAALPPAPRRGA